MGAEYSRVHIPAYIVAAASALFILLLGSPLAKLVSSMTGAWLVAIIEVAGASRHGGFDPSPVALQLLLLTYSTLEYAGAGSEWLPAFLLIVGLASTLISSSYWYSEGYTRPYTVIMPAALLAAPIVGFMAGARDPYIYASISILESSVLYGLNSWESTLRVKLAGHALAALTIYSLLYSATNGAYASMLLPVTYLAKLAFNAHPAISKAYTGVDPIVKALLGGVLG